MSNNSLIVFLLQYHLHQRRNVFLDNLKWKQGRDGGSKTGRKAGGGGGATAQNQIKLS